MKVSKYSTIHKRTKCFVAFIAPEKEKREKIKEQSDGIRKCVSDQAKEDGYTILSQPYSGSFAKKSGLRRHLLGDSEVEGQDIDIAFILKDEDKNGNPLGCMISTFEGYLNKCYPDSEVGSTKSSATISFTGSKNQFDVVPLIDTDRMDIQKLIRSNNEKRQSSVEKQAEFIKSRNRSSNELEGVVRFNDCLRLVKWWRYHQQSQPGGQFGNGEHDDKVPSFLLDLLCAKAYDELSVNDTYAETLARWFAYLAHVVRNREEVLFNGYNIKVHEDRQSARWKVIDPMDDTNNVVKNWPDFKIDDFATWFENARDRMTEAIRKDREGDDSGSMNCLVQLFGNSFKNQCKEI